MLDFVISDADGSEEVTAGLDYIGHSINFDEIIYFTDELEDTFTPRRSIVNQDYDCEICCKDWTTSTVGCATVNSCGCCTSDSVKNSKGCITYYSYLINFLSCNACCNFCTPCGSGPGLNDYVFRESRGFSIPVYDEFNPVDNELTVL